MGELLHGELLHNVGKLGRDAAAVTLLTGAGRLAAKVIIQGSTLAGHIDASCAVDPACEAMVVNFVQNILPTIAIPLMYAITKIGSVIVYNCSTHPDGGQNKGISAQLE